MKQNPCKECPDRYRACQDTCRKPERLEYIEEKNRLKEAEYKANAIMYYRHEAAKYRHRRKHR